MSDSEKFSILSSVIFTRNLILRLFCGIYLAAFLSFYIQAEGSWVIDTALVVALHNKPHKCIALRCVTFHLLFILGLFSHVNGIVPAEIEPIKGKLLHDQFLSFVDRPSWIRILKLFDVAIFPSIEVISLLGALFSFFGFVSTRFCIVPVFGLLWTFYYSLVDISKLFHQQSDDLLLEAGLICILLAPGLRAQRYGVADNVMLQLMRWLLFRWAHLINILQCFYDHAIIDFRFLFASGTVKLATGCPHWWNLTALKHHLLTLPLPTHLAFYSYYIPDGYLKLTTAFVNLSELLCPWLFFAPIRSLRIFSFYWQVFLQINIIATGNYGFLNFMIIVMLFSLLDDSHFKSNSNGGGVNYKKVISFILTMAAIFFIMVITMTFYKITFVDGTLDVSIRELNCTIFAT